MAAHLLASPRRLHLSRAALPRFDAPPSSTRRLAWTLCFDEMMQRSLRCSASLRSACAVRTVSFPPHEEVLRARVILFVVENLGCLF